MVLEDLPNTFGKGREAGLFINSKSIVSVTGIDPGFGTSSPQQILRKILNIEFILQKEL